MSKSTTNAMLDSTVNARRTPRRHQRVDDVEADLVVVRQHERRAPQHDPHPAEDGDLVGPAERLVQQVAKYDLQQERDEHQRHQHDGDVVGAAQQPAAGGRQRRAVLTRSRSIEFPCGMASAPPRRPRLRARVERGGSEAGSRDSYGRGRRGGYRALMRSSAPFGHSLPYLSTYFFCANVRKAAMSGV